MSELGWTYHLRTFADGPSPFVAMDGGGGEYHARVLAILASVDEADAAVATGIPAGPLRSDVHGAFVRRFILAGLHAFLHSDPDVQLHVGEGDRLVDLVAQGWTASSASASPPTAA